MDEKKQSTPQNQSGKESSDAKLFAALSYLWLLSVIILFVKKDNGFISYHAKQGTVLFIASLIFWFIPFLGWILNVAILVGVVVGFLKALSGEKFPLPVVSTLAEKITL